MIPILANLLDLSVILFAATSMVSVGFGYCMRDLIDPLRHRLRVMLELVGNFLLVPLLAWGLIQLYPLERSQEVGLILMASAAGAPLVIKLTQMAGEDVALAGSIVVLLLLSTVVYMPLVMPVILPEVQVSAWQIAKPLLLTLLLPLALSLGVKQVWPGVATRLQPLVARLSNLSLVVMLTIILFLSYRPIMGMLGSGAVVAAFVFTGGAFGIGYMTGVLGGKTPGRSGVVALVTAERNTAAAIVVATQGFHDSSALLMVVLCFLVGVLMLVPTAASAGWLTRQKEQMRQRTHRMNQKFFTRG